MFRTRGKHVGIVNAGQSGLSIPKIEIVHMADHWQVDETFFDLFRDKQAINAMLGEIAGEQVASGNINATAKVQNRSSRIV